MDVHYDMLPSPLLLGSFSPWGSKRETSLVQEGPSPGLVHSWQALRYSWDKRTGRGTTPAALLVLPRGDAGAGTHRASAIQHSSQPSMLNGVSSVQGS